MQKDEKITWFVVLGLFGLRYFLSALKPVTEVQMLFWIALILFNIWRVLASKR